MPRHDALGTRLRRYASVAEAMAAAAVTPCDNPKCQGNHVVVWCKGRQRVQPVWNGYNGGYNACERVICGVEIFDSRVRRSLAGELKACYPAGEPRPPAELLPRAGNGLNAPLGPCAPPVEGM